MSLPSLLRRLAGAAALGLFLFGPGFAEDEGADPAGVERVRAAFERNKAALEAYRVGAENPPEQLAGARTALAEVFRAGSLDQVHALLKDGTIGPELSVAMADIRNGMVSEVLRAMAFEKGDVHVTNFSPAFNLLNDIDQTFQTSKRLEELGRAETGSRLKADFIQAFTERFQIAPEKMDVVSHTSEAQIPDWRMRREVHDFVGALRKGSRLLSSNPEAYFLEGAFRLQVERRSFASDMPLYSVYSYSPRLMDEDNPTGATRVDAVVEREDGTIRDLAYKGRAPEIRRSYAAGSTIGNWWFMTQHGGGTRYVSKYGLRSFSEGPGFLVKTEGLAPGEPLTPREYENLTYAERQDMVADVYNTHFRGGEVDRQTLWKTLETARVIRNLKDGYTPERAYRERALELVGGDEAAYESNKAALLAQADLEFRETMTKVMVRNIEVAVPERLSDWLEPRVNPAELGFTEEQVRAGGAEFEKEMSNARKRLRTTALFECMQGLRVLEPEVRERVLESSIETLKRRSDRSRNGKYPFERTLRSLANLAGQQATPRLLQTDQERFARYEIQDGLIVVKDRTPLEAGRRPAPKLAEQVDQVRRELDAAFDADGVSGLNPAYAWDRALAEAEDNLRARVEMFDPSRLEETRLSLRRSLWESLGWRAERDWTAMSSGTDPVEGMTFDRRAAMQNVVNWGNAQSVLNILKAYRAAPGNDPDKQWEAVMFALGMEVAGRIPYVGDMLQIENILAGRENPFIGSGLMLTTFMYPAVGKALVVYGVVSGVIEILIDVRIQAEVLAEYQGMVPSDDGSPPPGRSPNVFFEDVPGLLEPIHAWMLQRRRELLQEQPVARGVDAKEIELLLTHVFPENPTYKQVRAAVFFYYDPVLNTALERNGKSPEEWDSIKLGSYGGTILSNDPVHTLNANNLPPLVRAFFRPLVRDYFTGKGAFKDMPAHAAAHAHPLLHRQYFHGRSDTARAQAIEDLTTVLTAAYVNAKRAGTGALVIPGEWDARANVAASAYLFGLPADAFRGIPIGVPDAGPAPALPALLDALRKPTLDEARAGFVGYVDGILDEKLRRYAAKHGGPPPGSWDEFKLGEHHPDLTPVAAENARTTHPLLEAFFTKVVLDYWKLRTDPDDDPVGEPVVMDDGFVLDPVDTSSVGPSESVGMPVDPWFGAVPENEITGANKQRVVAGVTAMLKADYKAGHQVHLGIRKQLSDYARELDLLPAAAALGSLRDGIWGARDDTRERPAAKELAAHEWLPTLAHDEEVLAFVEDTIRRMPDDVEIEITGAPEAPLALGQDFELACAVEACDVRWERPFRVEWQVETAGTSHRRESEGASPRQRQHDLAFLVGDEEEGLREQQVTVTALVTDATGRDMGRESVTFRIGAREAAEEEELPPPVTSGGGLGGGDSGDEEEREVDRVAYLIRVSGSGWIPHYAGGSYITSGSNEEILWVKAGQDPQQLIEEYRKRLDKPPCEVEIPAIPGLGKRPSLWTDGPNIEGVDGPFFEFGWRYSYDFKSKDTWKFSDQDGPSLGKIREMFGCN